MNAPPLPQAFVEAREQNRSGSVATKRIFEVTGPQRIAGKSKGETVELELTDAQVAALVASGAVKEVTKTDKRSQGQKEE